MVNKKKKQQLKNQQLRDMQLKDQQLKDQQLRDLQVLQRVQEMQKKHLSDVTEQVCESSITCCRCGVHFVRAC